MGQSMNQEPGHILYDAAEPLEFQEAAIEIPRPDNPSAEAILAALRRIFRAMSIHSRSLNHRAHLTLPQLVCLRRLSILGPCGPSELSRQVSLSQATVTGILDRLENRGYITRDRRDKDRRRVTISLTQAGLDMVASMPTSLQDRFASRLAMLSEREQSNMVYNLGRIVEMMEDTNDSLSLAVLTRETGEAAS
jgi:DNA-binding MarR family transcriptional regulator